MYLFFLKFLFIIQVALYTPVHLLLHSRHAMFELERGEIQIGPHLLSVEQRRFQNVKYIRIFNYVLTPPSPLKN